MELEKNTSTFTEVADLPSDISDQFQSEVLHKSAKLTESSLVSHVSFGRQCFFGLVQDSSGKKVNVHLILVESLMDPQTLPGVRFSRDPFAPLFREAVERGSLALSPVFGHRSPDTEWEVLCGVPATLDRSQVVFADVRNKTLDCLPRKLGRLGWKTVATHPVQPDFFNSRRSYEKLGFATVRMAPDLDLADSDGTVGFRMAPLDLPNVSAESLLDQNLSALRQHMAQGETILNYVFVTSGHFPFALNPGRRSRVIRAEPDGDLVELYANHVHYNTGAVQSFIEKVVALDPDAVFVVLGDHPPPLPESYFRPSAADDPGDGASRAREVPLIVLHRGELKRVAARTPAYLVPEIIMDVLSGGGFCRSGPCLKDRESVIRTLPGRAVVLDKEGRFLRLCKTASDPPPPCREAIAFDERNKLRLFDALGYTPLSKH